MVHVIFNDDESAWWALAQYRFTRLGENMGNYSSKYVTGAIGEKEGRKWLKEQGYEVCDFGRMSYFYFWELEKTVDRLKIKRKQKYIEEDKIRINSLEHGLKGIFGEKFEGMRQFFKAFYQLKEEIREEMRETRKYGILGVGLDFIVKRNNDFSFVEVKANQSTLSKHQRMCFKIAKSYGFKTMVLKVKVESNIPKDFCLTEF
jgi:hypothetical protein